MPPESLSQFKAMFFKNNHSLQLTYEETEVLMRRPFTDTSKEITKKLCEFDTEMRITGKNKLFTSIQIMQQRSQSP